MAIATPADLRDQVTGQPKKKPDYTGQLPEYTYNPDVAFQGNGGRFPTALYPAPRQSLVDIMGQQLGIANNYAQDSQGLIDKQQNAYARDVNNQLKDSIKQTRNDFNRRGLLRSGARMGAESANRYSAALDLAKNRASLNENALNTQNSLENNALNSGLLYTGSAPNLGISTLAGTAQGVQNDISDMDSAGSIYGGAASGLGKLIGSILANRK